MPATRGDFAPRRTEIPVVGSRGGGITDARFPASAPALHRLDHPGSTGPRPLGQSPRWGSNPHCRRSSADHEGQIARGILDPHDPRELGQQAGPWAGRSGWRTSGMLYSVTSIGLFRRRSRGSRHTRPPHKACNRTATRWPPLKVPNAGGNSAFQALDVVVLRHRLQFLVEAHSKSRSEVIRCWPSITSTSLEDGSLSGLHVTIVPRKYSHSLSSLS